MKSTTTKTSTIRSAIGVVMLIAAAGIYLGVLPEVSSQRTQQQRAAKSAKEQRDSQQKALNELKTKADNIELSRARMEEILGSMSNEGEGPLKWNLRKVLHELGGKHSVRIQSVKYGAPAKEGAKGTNLETIDVEVVSTGIYQSVKAFILALEQSNLPFGLAGGRMEEAPDGLRLTLTLRAFRRATQEATSDAKEGQ